MSNIGDNLQTLFAKMENFISTKTVVGEAVHYGDVTLIPLVEVSFGAGSGGSDASGGETPKGEAGGGGLGAKLTPSAVVVITGDTVQLVNVKNQESLGKLIDMVPGVLAKINGMFAKKAAKTDAE